MYQIIARGHISSLYCKVTLCQVGFNYNCKRIVMFFYSNNDTNSLPKRSAGLRNRLSLGYYFNIKHFYFKYCQQNEVLNQP